MVIAEPSNVVISVISRFGPILDELGNGRLLCGAVIDQVMLARGSPNLRRRGGCRDS